MKRTKEELDAYILKHKNKLIGRTGKIIYNASFGLGTKILILGVNTSEHYFTIARITDPKRTNNIRWQDVELDAVTKEEFETEINELEKNISLLKEKKRFLEETKDEVFDENKFYYSKIEENIEKGNKEAAMEIFLKVMTNTTEEISDSLLEYVPDGYHIIGQPMAAVA